MIKRKSLAMLVALSMSTALVGCSSDENSNSEGGSATQEQSQEETQEKEKEETQEALVLVDDETVKVTIVEKINDEIFGPTYKVEIENKTDKKMIVQTRDVSVDGMMEDPLFSEEITAGKKAQGDMTFMNIEGLENLKNIEGKLVILDENYGEVTSYDMVIE